MTRIIDTKRAPAGPTATTVLAVPIDLDTAPTSVGPFAMVGQFQMPAVPPGVLPVDVDVRPHPHIGLAAISYVLDGAITHRDSLGNRHELFAGDVGVTVAGRGAVHSERFERLRLLGGALDMFQLLLALPDGAEDVDPSFFVRRVAATGASTRWLLPAPPELPAGLPSTTPVLLADVALEAGATWSLPVVPARALYVWEGDVELGSTRVTAGQVAIAPPSNVDEIAIRARTAARFLAFGGTTVGPRWFWWNYLHSSLERLEAAKKEWREGRAKLPPGDTESFTPAPADDGRPLRHLNGREMARR